MSDSVKEQLSACLDGELAAAELDLLLKRVGGSSELRDAMGRYALLSEAIRGEKSGARAPAGFASRVMAAIEDEPVIAHSRFRASPALVRRLRPAAGFAVAAGVAAVAVLSVQRTGPDPAQFAQEERGAQATQTLAFVDPEPSYTVPTGASTSAFIPATRLTNYVVAHSEYSSTLGRRSVLSGVLAEDDAAPDAPENAPPVIELQAVHP